MRIGGFQKMTLIDYPGKIAATVFTVGCTFRCGFCHNPELVLPEKFPPLNDEEKKFFEHLVARKGKLEGVCITGGEPTIQPDIISFIKKIKKLGYLVKLDSNGSRPDVLKKIIDAKLVDFIAMDIKSGKSGYSRAIGLDFDLDKIDRSIKMIMKSGIDYEFRTTVVPSVHTEKDFEEIGKWIKGAKSYCLQEYRERHILDPKLKKENLGKKLDLKKIRRLLRKNIGKIGIRENN